MPNVRVMGAVESSGGSVDSHYIILKVKYIETDCESAPLHHLSGLSVIFESTYMSRYGFRAHEVHQSSGDDMYTHQDGLPNAEGELLTQEPHLSRRLGTSVMKSVLAIEGSFAVVACGAFHTKMSGFVALPTASCAAIRAVRSLNQIPLSVAFRAICLSSHMRKTTAVFAKHVVG